MTGRLRRRVGASLHPLAPHLLAAVALTTLTIGVIAAAGGRARIPFVLAVTVAVMVLRLALRRIDAAVATIAWPLAVGGSEHLARPSSSIDARTTFLEISLRRSTEDAFAFTRRLQPSMRAVAGERLRRAHGIDIDVDPAAARAVIGQDLWTMLTEPTPRPVSARRLHDAVECLERL